MTFIWNTLHLCLGKSFQPIKVWLKCKLQDVFPDCLNWKWVLSPLNFESLSPKPKPLVWLTVHYNSDSLPFTQCLILYSTLISTLSLEIHRSTIRKAGKILLISQLNMRQKGSIVILKVSWRLLLLPRCLVRYPKWSSQWKKLKCKAK